MTTLSAPNENGGQPERRPIDSDQPASRHRPLDQRRDHRTAGRRREERQREADDDDQRRDQVEQDADGADHRLRSVLPSERLAEADIERDPGIVFVGLERECEIDAKRPHRGEIAHARRRHQTSGYRIPARARHRRCRHRQSRPRQARSSRGIGSRRRRRTCSCRRSGRRRGSSARGSGRRSRGPCRDRRRRAGGMGATSRMFSAVITPPCTRPARTKRRSLSIAW